MTNLCCYKTCFRFICRHHRKKRPSLICNLSVSSNVIDLQRSNNGNRDCVCHIKIGKIRKTWDMPEIGLTRGKSLWVIEVQQMWTEQKWLIYFCIGITSSHPAKTNFGLVAHKTLLTVYVCGHVSLCVCMYIIRHSHFGSLPPITPAQ